MIEVRRKPWHGVSIAPELRDIDTVMEQAGLDFTVSARPLATTGLDDAEPRIPVPGYVANVRDDSDDPLGVVSTRYSLFQPRQMLEFGEAIVDQGNSWDTAGPFYGGRWIFAAIRLDQSSIMVGGTDRVDPYLLLSNRFDGRGSLEAVLTMIRGVCENTVQAAIRRASHRFAVRHTGDLSGRVQAARDALEISFGYVEEFGLVAERLAATTMDADDAVATVLRVFPLPEGKELLEVPNSTAARVLTVLAESPRLDGFRATGWGVYNAVTEYLDHEARYRNADTRAESLLVGRAADTRQRALDALLG